MSTPAIRTIFVLCCAGWLKGADVVVLSDGDRISGTVQKLEDGKLFFKTKHSGTALEINWDLVSTLSTDSKLQIKLKDGTEGSGKLAASASGLSLLAAEESTELATKDVVGLTLKAETPVAHARGWWARTRDNSSVSADFGQSFSGLAQYNQLSSSSDVTYEGDRWDVYMLTRHYYYGETDSANSTYQAYGRLVAHRYIRGDKFFLFPYLFFGRQTTPDGGKGQIRQFGGGAGYTLRRHKPDQVSLYGGVVRSSATGFTWVSEETRIDSRLDDMIFVTGVSWQRSLKGNIATNIRLHYFKPIQESGLHAMATDASIKIPLFGPAYFSVRAYDTPELRQKQLFSIRNLQVSSGIGIEF